MNSDRLIRKLKNAALAALPLLLVACANIQPAPEPTYSQYLDELYISDRVAWRAEMCQMVMDQEAKIPPKHLALAVNSFNAQGERQLFLESVWRYLRVRGGNGPKLNTSADRKLLAHYAELALRSPDATHHKRLKSLCLSLEGEAVCSRA